MAVFVQPGQNNFPGLDRGFNQRFTLSSVLSGADGQGVYLVESPQDIVDTLTMIATKYGVESGDIRAVSGGHCYENFVFEDESSAPTGYSKYILDLSNMRGIYEANIEGTDFVVIEPGASNWLVQTTLHSKYGAAIPGGSCYSVCAGGHIPGGGYGLLSRLHGLTIDYLSGVEMVVPGETASSFRIREFSPSDDPDQLDWAHRGGGAGHFGIITKLFFEKSRIPPSPERAIFITLPVSWDQFRGNIQNFTAFLQKYYLACAALPGQAFTLGKFTMDTGDSDAVMSIAIQIVYGTNSGHNASTFGGKEIPPLLTKTDAENVLESFWAELDQWIDEPSRSRFAGRKYRLAGHPVSAVVNLDTIYDLPWIDMTQMLNGSGENQKGKYKSCNMISNFVEAEAAAIFEMLTTGSVTNPIPGAVNKDETLVQVDSYGLQINSLDQSGAETAVAARNSVLKLQYQTYWKTMESRPPESDREIVSWFNEAYSTVYRAAQGNGDAFPGWSEKFEGCYFNYPDIQIGVNPGHAKDPGSTANDSFENVYFSKEVADRLKSIKGNVDPNNIFSFAQSIPLPDPKANLGRIDRGKRTSED